MEAAERWVGLALDIHQKAAEETSRCPGEERSLEKSRAGALVSDPEQGR
jgi:hypothetical protein